MRAAVLLLALLSAGCAGPRAVEFYTKPEVDALNAETACKALAKNLVQMARCSRPAP